MPRTLTEDEFNAVKAKVLASLPAGLSEDEFNRQIGPRMEAALGEAENTPVEGGSVGRFVSNAAEMLNPISIAKGVGNAVLHPIDTATNIYQAQKNEAQTAIDAAKAGDYGRAVGHGLAAAVPLVGPAAAQAGEQIAQGDIAGGLGKATGILAPFGVAAGVQAVRAATPAGVAERVAGGLESGAQARVVDVMAPKVGANKARFGGMAEKVAPDLLERGDAAAFSREGLHQNVQAGLAQAEQALDAAHDARLNGRAFPTQPIVADLMAKRANLTAKAVEGSQYPPKTTNLNAYGEETINSQKVGQPIGKDVVPAPNAARVAAIDKAIQEVKALGPVARYDSLRAIRQAWDGPANARYNPATTTDFLKNQGYANGAADVTGSLRDALARFDPATADANAQYSLYKTANDVLNATAEVERTRPKVGRQIMARLTGATIGGQTAGAAGAVGGFVFGPAVDAALAAGGTTKLQTAQLMTKLASAIRNGDVGSVNSLSVRLQQMAKRASVANQTGRVTSPSESQPDAAPALAPAP